MKELHKFFEDMHIILSFLCLFFILIDDVFIKESEKDDI